MLAAQLTWLLKTVHHIATKPHIFSSTYFAWIHSHNNHFCTKGCPMEQDNQEVESLTQGTGWEGSHSILPGEGDLGIVVYS